MTTPRQRGPTRSARFLRFTWRAFAPFAHGIGETLRHIRSSQNVTPATNTGETTADWTHDHARYGGHATTAKQSTYSNTNVTTVASQPSTFCLSFVCLSISNRSCSLEENQYADSAPIPPLTNPVSLAPASLTNQKNTAYITTNPHKVNASFFFVVFFTTPIPCSQLTAWFILPTFRFTPTFDRGSHHQPTNTARYADTRPEQYSANCRERR